MFLYRVYLLGFQVTQNRAVMKATAWCSIICQLAMGFLLTHVFMMSIKLLWKCLKCFIKHIDFLLFFFSSFLLYGYLLCFLVSLLNKVASVNGTSYAIKVHSIPLACSHNKTVSVFIYRSHIFNVWVFSLTAVHILHLVLFASFYLFFVMLLKINKKR